MDAWEGHRCAKHYKSPLTPEERLERKERRKHSNRESAKRSRLRKQIERHNLEVSVEALTNESNYLREELKMLSEECKKLASENILLKRFESSKHLGLEKVPKDEADAPADE